jgi:hypothetical protein
MVVVGEGAAVVCVAGFAVVVVDACGSTPFTLGALVSVVSEVDADDVEVVVLDGEICWARTFAFGLELLSEPTLIPIRNAPPPTMIKMASISAPRDFTQTPCSGKQ